MELPRTIPDRSEWDSLRPRLEPGELQLAELLADGLPDWTIAVQPRIWNARPDIIAFHPEKGLAVYEVKDWHYGTRELKYDKKLGVLKARSASGGEWYVTSNPVGQVFGYVEEVKNLFEPEEQDARSRITVVVVMSNFTKEQAMKTLKPLVPTRFKGALGMEGKRFFRINGSEELQSGAIDEFLPAAFDPDLQFEVSDQTNSRLTALLAESDVDVVQRTPLILDDDKESFLRNPRGTRIRRVRGAAGTGKSALLAASAADAALDGKDVLLVGYNITLRHTLHDLVVRRRIREFDPREVSRSVREKVAIYYLHEWAAQVCIDTGYEKPLRMLLKRHRRYPEEQVKGLVKEALEGRGCWSEETQTGASLFDRILVDEAQNIDADWFRLMQGVLRDERSEAVIAVDPTQSLYLKEPSWTDEAMSGVGVTGAWTHLRFSYRLPPAAIPMLRQYCQQFLQNEADVLMPRARTPDSDQEEIPGLNFLGLYRDERGGDDLVGAVADLVVGLPERFEISPADIAFLLPNHEMGLRCVNYLKDRDPGWQNSVAHVFGNTPEQRKRRKRSFWPGRGESKGSTIHSFQGWEARCVVLGIPRISEDGTFDSDNDFVRNYWKAVYIGLTRVADSPRGSYLVVVNGEPTLHDFFNTWFDKED